MDKSKSVHQLEYRGKPITLIGTAHVSHQSVALVEETIHKMRPDTVCVELCEARYNALKDKNRWRNMDIFKVLREKKAFLLLSNLILQAFQRRIADKLDIKPGQEMLKAIECAEAIGAETHLADRDIQLTLARTWRSMGFWTKIKLLFQLLLSIGESDKITEEEIEAMKQKDVLENLLAELGQSSPVLKKILIDERDLYLAQKIKTAPGGRILAVVGAGHVPGIIGHWEEEIDLTPLEVLPDKRRLSGIIKWGIPVLILILMIYGFWRGGAQTGTGMLTFWVLANGVLAGLGALIAMGHPLTIAASVLCAPLTSLNPMIAAGWVSGLVEAFSRKPKVRDFEALPEDILSFRGFWKNKVTRILLVVVFTNLGSMLGTMVAIPLMARLL